jgi:O-antigen/teichoic acid export membrane protein
MSIGSEIARESTAGGLMDRLARGWKGIWSSGFLKKSSLSVIDQGVVSGTSFATSVLLGRFATQEDLGVYYLALSVVYFARGVQEQLVSAPYMIYCGRKEGRELAEYAGSSLIHQCVMMGATAGVLLVALMAGVLPGPVATAFWLLVLAAPLMLMREFARQMSFAHLDLARATALDVTAAGLQFFALLGLALCGRMSVMNTLAVLALSSGMATIGWLATSRQGMLARAAATVRDWFHNWQFARWALASQLLAATTPYVMPWVIAVTHGEAQTGLLGACSTLVGLSNTFLQGLCNFLSPRAAQAFSRGGVAELRGVLVKTALLFAATLGSLAVAAFFLGEQVAMLVYGPQFVGAGPIISVLSLSVLANSIGVVAGNGLWAIERPSANFVADLCSLVVVVVTATVLVPLWGPLGAASATLAGTATDAVVRMWILRLSLREIAMRTLAKEGAAA